MAENIILEKPGLTDSQVSLTPAQAAAPSDTGLGATSGSAPSTLQQGLANSGYVAPSSSNNPADIKMGSVGAGTQGYVDRATGKFVAGDAPNGENRTDSSQGYNDSVTGKWIYGKAPVTPTNTMSSSAATSDSNSTADIIRQEQDALLQQMRAQTAGINAQYDLQQTMDQNTQTEENATNKATQFKLGREGTDYASSSIQKLNTLHSQQMQQLGMQRQAALSQAVAAFNNGNISLAKELVQNAQATAKAQADAQKAQSEQQSRDIQDAINKQTLMSKTMDNLATSNIQLTSISDVNKAAYEQQFGIPPGSFDALYTATQKAAQVKSAKDLADLATSFGNLADKIPVGTTQDIKLPDGSIYTVQGAKQPEHSTSYKEWQDYKSTGGKLDYNSYQTMDANRKRAVTNISLQNDQLTKTLVNKFAPTIEKAVGEDNKISPDDWNSLRTGWVKEGGSGPVFDASFGQFIDGKHAKDYFTEKLPSAYNTGG